MDASAEQLVLDYLGRLGDAAQRVLSLDERLRFMVSARVAIAGQIEETRVTDVAEVRRLLGRYGDPEELAARERQRLDEASAASRASAAARASTASEASQISQASQASQAASGGERPVRTERPAQTGRPAQINGFTQTERLAQTEPAAPSDPPAQTQRPAGTDQPARTDRGARTTRLAAPSAQRPVTARWRPGAPAGPRQADRNPAGEGPADRGPGDRELADRSTDAGLSRPAAPAGPLRPAAPVGPSDRVVPDAGPGRRPGSETNGTEPSGGPIQRSGAGLGGLAVGAGAGPARPAAPGASRASVMARSVLALARSHPLEAIAVLLLGVGGLASPFPLWFLGALVVLISRLWDARDKWTSLAIPVLIALVGSLVMAGQGSYRGGLPAYLDAARVDGWDLMRAGAVLGAAYLAWRVRQGRRARREPPWRRTGGDALR